MEENPLVTYMECCSSCQYYNAGKAYCVCIRGGENGSIRPYYRCGRYDHMSVGGARNYSDFVKRG